MHYLDNAATTQTLPEAVQAAVQAMTQVYGNPSSLHAMGLQASHLLTQSRNTVACAMGVLPECILFTSCGTESTNTALQGVAYLHRHQKGHIITTAIEHAATLQTVKQLEAQGFRVTRLAPDSSGHIPVTALDDALTDDTILLSCQLVNNEIGTRQPVEALGERLKVVCPHALFHIDAVQGLGKVRLMPQRWHCDLMSVSGHKIGAPKGIGALFIRKGLHLPSLLFGGGQENGLRSGTEPLPNIAAFAVACTHCVREFDAHYAHVTALADALKQEIAARFPTIRWNGVNDVPHILNLSVPGCQSEVLMRVLEAEQVYVSTGSACSKGRQSGVLKALGLPKEQIDSAIRVSFAPTNTREDVIAFVQAVQKGIQYLT